MHLLSSSLRAGDKKAPDSRKLLAEAGALLHVLDGENFRCEVLGHSGVVLVEFWASWCGPCRMLSAALAEIAAEEAGPIKACRVDIDTNMRLSVEFQIMSLPTLLVFQDGVMVYRIIGALPKAALLERIRKWLPEPHDRTLS